MLLEMLFDMLDCVEDVFEWGFFDYEGYFENLIFKDCKFVVMVYYVVLVYLWEYLEVRVVEINVFVIEV